MGNNVQAWYNEFAQKQLKTSVNLRHFVVYNQIVKSGLKRDSKVLEIGCGIGTLTGLLYSYLKNGQLLAADISNESIEIAKKRIGISSRIQYMVTDMIDFSVPEKFDFVILPDVMEHIPVEQHLNLFHVISKHTHEKSIVFIHIPHPKAIEFLQKYFPEKLQIIDQSLSAEKLLSDAYANDFILIEYKSYPLFHYENDYALIRLGKNIEQSYSPKPKQNIIIKKAFERIKYYWSLI